MNNTYKIIIISLWYPNKSNPFDGIFIKTQAHLLAKNDCEMTVLHRYWGNKCDKTIIESAPNITEYFFSIRKHKLILLSYIQYVRCLQKYLKTHDTHNTILHAHVTVPSGVIGVIAGKIFKLPVVVTAHSSGDLGKVSRVRNLLNKFVVKHSNSFITVGQNLKKSIESATKIQDKIIVVPNMVNTELFALRNETKTDTFKILSVGNLIKEKGYFELLDAIKKLQENGYNNLQLSIVGKGDIKNLLQQRIIDLGLTNIAFLLGPLPNEDVSRLMSQNDLFVHASHKETFGVVLIEAMASGLPVVATRCGEPEFLIKDFCGVLVEKENADSLCDGIKNVMVNYQKYDKNNIRDYTIQNYSETVVVKKIKEVYKQCLTQ